jgi:hypothetical protein
MAHSKTSRHVARWPIDPKAAPPSAAAPEKTKADAGQSDAGEKPAGRIVHDERGNAVWKPGGGDSTSTMLKKLEVPELKFEGQEEHKGAAPAATKPAAPHAQPEAPVDPGGGYNPYDQAKIVKKPAAPKAPAGRRSK